MSKSLEELQHKIGEMLVAYNQDLAYDEADRIAAVELHLTRPEKDASREKPTSIFITTKDFTHEPVGKEVFEVPTFKSGAVTVTYAMSMSSSLQCCAPGWVGLYDSQGGLHGCFPQPWGPCRTYTGPIRCNVPG